MASKEPSENEISGVFDFTGLDPVDDRLMVIRALKNNNGDTQSVVSQFYDNPDSFRSKYGAVWDDSMFAADRDGSGQNTGISFHIESPTQNDVIHGVTPPPEPYGMGAPSRPPSRSNNRSPLGRMIDLTASDAPGMPNSQAQEDEDIERALRESAQEAGLSMPQHETGVIDNANPSPSFGPANRTDYDQGNWAMVPISQPETKLSGAPPPSLRQRSGGAPAFLVQGHSIAGNHKLGGLLTMLHEIPLARNVLLECGTPAASYGHNSEWWKGQEILPPHVLAQLQSGEMAWGEQQQARPDFYEEIHRLMAFLDSTERSYATVSVVADLVPDPQIGVERQFYEKIGHDNPKEKIQPIMQSASMVNVLDESLGGDDANFGLLEMEHLRSEYTVIKTLYESLDHVMWSDVLSWNELHEASKMAMFKEMGEVLVIRMGGDGPEESIDIPTELYPEKYLASRKDEARRIQIAWCQARRAMVKLMEQEQALYHWRDEWNNQIHDKRTLFNKATEQWKEYQQYLDGLSRYRAMEKSGFDTNRFPEYHQAPADMNEEELQYFEKVTDVVSFTEGVLSNIGDRLKMIHVQLEQVQTKVRFLGKLLTDPNKPGRPQPMTCNKYLLRGVATAVDVVYVCQQVEQDLINLDDVEKELADQWWRLAYTPNEDVPVKAEKVDIELVLKDMWQETKSPLLVYATETALSTPRTALEPALQRFVKAENKAFRQELNSSSAMEVDNQRSGPLDPISPSKRKHRSDSFDSMDSNRASIGSDDRSGFDNPFADQGTNTPQEIMTMSDQLSGLAPHTSIEPMTPEHSTNSDLRLDSTSNTSNTLTPGTVIEGDGDAIQPDISTSLQQDITASGRNETKSPEMQERARPPSFIAFSRDASETKRLVDAMNMDIPEHQGDES